MRQRLKSGVGGTLRFVPSEVRDYGIPTAATVSITTASGAELTTPVTDAAGTIDSVSTTVNGAVTAGAKSLVVTSATGINIGSRYLIACNDDGERLVVRVVGKSSTTMRLAAPLPRDVPTSSSFLGIEITYAVSAGNATVTAGSSEWPYGSEVSATGPAPVDRHLFRASWTYTIASVSYTGDQLFEVNARLLKPTLMAEEIVTYLPDAPEHLTSANDSSTFTVFMEDAWLEVLDDLAVHGYRPDRVMDPDRLRRPHLYKTLELLGMTWGSPYKDWVEDRRKLYRETFDAAINSGDWYDADASGTMSSGEVKWPTVVLTR